MAHRIVRITRRTDRPTPPEQLFPAFVDYYLTLLVARGPGELRAEPKGGNDDVVEWTFRSFVHGDGSINHRAAGVPEVIDRLPRGLFRPVLARVGFRLTDTEDCYGGYGRFRVHFEDEPQPRDALFCVYLANERSVGTWVRIHWYGPNLEWDLTPGDGRDLSDAG